MIFNLEINIVNLNTNDELVTYYKEYSAKGPADVIKRTIFISSADYRIKSNQQLINSFENGYSILSIVFQKPLGADLVTIEEIILPNAVQYKIKKSKDIELNTLTITSQTTTILLNSFQSIENSNKATAQDIFQVAMYKFEQLQTALENEGMSFNSVVRQWSYIESILELSELESGIKQHYQIFNDVRSYYYKNRVVHGNYMAGTGIGIDSGVFTTEIIAIKTNEKWKQESISNPSQINAYEYSNDQLYGTALSIVGEISTPKFARAKAIYNEENAIVFISGTASVIGEESVYINDIKKQTYTACENIKRVMNAIKTHDFSTNMGVDYLISMRIYIKQSINYSGIKDQCEIMFPNVRKQYLRADLCRSNLDVEIEAIAKR